MNEDKINFKIFTAITIFLISIVFFLLVKNLIDFRNLTVKKENLINIKKDLEKIISTEEFNNLTKLEQSYQSYIKENTLEEGITSYTNLINNSASENNISIIDTRVVESNSNYFDIQNTIRGNPESIKNMIVKIDSESSLREVIKSDIKFFKNQIEMEIVVRNWKIK